jgi:hypothetical protein
MATKNYVNNPEFLEAIVQYKKLCSEAEDSGDPQSQIEALTLKYPTNQRSKV